MNIDGITPHEPNIRNNDPTGAIWKYTHSLILVVTPSLLNSLIPSNTGCTTPFIDTLLGPTRYWGKDSTLRSNNVKYATPNIVQAILKLMTINGVTDPIPC